MELNKRDQIIWYCLYVPACTSLASSLWVLLSYCLFDKLQTPTMRLVMIQAVTHVFLSICNNVAFFNVPSTGTMACDFQGWSLSFCFVWTVLAAVAISVYMLLTIERKRRISLSWKRLMWLTAAQVLFSALLAFAPFITDQFGYIGARCWIQESGSPMRRQNGTILRFAGYFVIVWVCNIIIVWSYYRVIRYVHYLDSNNILSARAQFIHRTVNVLLMYPVISIVVWTPITVIRVITAIDREYVPATPFLGACMVLVSGQGTFFAFVFARYRVVQEGWGRLLRRFLVKCCPSFVPSNASLEDSQKEEHDIADNGALEIVRFGAAAAGKGPQPLRSGSKRRNDTGQGRKLTGGVRSNPLKSGTPEVSGSSGQFNGDPGAGRHSQVGSAVGPSLGRRIFSTFADMDLQLPDDDANYDGDDEPSRPSDSSCYYHDGDDYYNDDDGDDQCGNIASYVDTDFVDQVENPAMDIWRRRQAPGPQTSPSIGDGPVVLTSTAYLDSATERATRSSRDQDAPPVVIGETV